MNPRRMMANAVGPALATLIVGCGASQGPRDIAREFVLAVVRGASTDATTLSAAPFKPGSFIAAYQAAERATTETVYDRAPPRVTGSTIFVPKGRVEGGIFLTERSFAATSEAYVLVAMPGTALWLDGSGRTCVNAGDAFELKLKKRGERWMVTDLSNQGEIVAGHLPAYGTRAGPFCVPGEVVGARQ